MKKKKKETPHSLRCGSESLCNFKDLKTKLEKVCLGVENPSYVTSG